MRSRAGAGPARAWRDRMAGAPIDFGAQHRRRGVQRVGIEDDRPGEGEGPRPRRSRGPATKTRPRDICGLRSISSGARGRTPEASSGPTSTLPARWAPRGPRIAAPAMPGAPPRPSVPWPLRDSQDGRAMRGVPRRGAAASSSAPRSSREVHDIGVFTPPPVKSPGFIAMAIVSSARTAAPRRHPASMPLQRRAPARAPEALMRSIAAAIDRARSTDAQHAVDTSEDARAGHHGRRCRRSTKRPCGEGFAVQGGGVLPPNTSPVEDSRCCAATRRRRCCRVRPRRGSAPFTRDRCGESERRRGRRAPSGGMRRGVTDHAQLGVVRARRARATRRAACRERWGGGFAARRG